VATDQFRHSGVFEFPDFIDRGNVACAHLGERLAIDGRRLPAGGHCLDQPLSQLCREHARHVPRADEIRQTDVSPVPIVLALADGTARSPHKVDRCGPLQRFHHLVNAHGAS
jgi:hypothetical protein